MADTDKPALKPCPFCGGKAQVLQNEWAWRTIVECQRCSCRTSDYARAGNAKKAWNRRAGEEKRDG